MAKARWGSRLCHLLTRGDTLWCCLAVVSIISLLGQELSRCSVLAADFEGFGDEADDDLLFESDQTDDLPSVAPVPPPTITQSDFETDRGPPEQSTFADPSPPKPSSPPATTTFEYWDEDEFEGLPTDLPPQSPTEHENVAAPTVSEADAKPSVKAQPGLASFTVEIVCVSFLIAFVFNYFTGKRENENIALAWATQFATKDSIFDKNFSLLGTGDGKDTPLLLKEGQNVFKFYASGRRFCQGLLATMELKSRHDLISRIYNAIVPCKDEITFEVYMNDDAMDQVVFALAKKKLAKVMHKEDRDLQRFASMVSSPSNRKWVVEDLSVISESREVAGDLITETVLDQADTEGDN